MVAVVVMKSYDKFDISGFHVRKQPRRMDCIRKLRAKK